ncbi:adhesion G-protein coupled receptor G2 [Xiphophorus maculatus]|uniref:adhesion G-protein coupled receptor G2 n=1 Tax=Xiphophorus maculatus TaxID=8083 RepID=UPI000C6DCEDC|nr:adhesion G-protein coupled receptor G2 [Xiphophorus maculatus]
MFGLFFEATWRRRLCFHQLIFFFLAAAAPPTVDGYFLGDIKAVLNGCEDHWALRDGISVPLLSQMTVCVNIRVVVPGPWVAFSYSSVRTLNPDLGLEGDDKAIYGWLLQVQHRFPFKMSPMVWHRVCLRRDVRRNIFSLEVDHIMVAERTVIAQAIPLSGSLWLGCHQRNPSPGGAVGKVELYLFRMWADLGEHRSCEDGTEIGWDANYWDVTSPNAKETDHSLPCDHRRLRRDTNPSNATASGVDSVITSGAGSSRVFPAETSYSEITSPAVVRTTTPDKSSANQVALSTRVHPITALPAERSRTAVTCDISQLCSNKSAYYWIPMSVKAEQSNKTEQDLRNLVSKAFDCSSTSNEAGFSNFCEANGQLQVVEVTCRAKPAATKSQTVCNVLLFLSRAMSACDLQHAGNAALQRAGGSLQANITGNVERVGRTLCEDGLPSSGDFVRCTSTSSLDEICRLNRTTNVTCSVLETNSVATPQQAPNSCSGTTPRFCNCSAFCETESQLYAIKIKITSNTTVIHLKHLLLKSNILSVCIPNLQGVNCSDIVTKHTRTHLECYGEMNQRFYSCMVVLEMSGPVNSCSLSKLVQLLIEKEEFITTNGSLSRMMVCGGPPDLSGHALLASNLNWSKADLLPSDVCQPGSTLIKCEANETLAVLLADSCPPDPKTKSTTQSNSLTSPTSVTHTIANAEQKQLTWSPNTSFSPPNNSTLHSLTSAAGFSKNTTVDYKISTNQAVFTTASFSETKNNNVSTTGPIHNQTTAITTSLLTSTKTTTQPLLSSAPSTSVLPSSETKTYGTTTSTKTTNEPPTSYVPSTSVLPSSETKSFGTTTSTKTTTQSLLSSAPSTSVLPSSETKTYDATTSTKTTTDPLLSSAPSTSVLPSSETKSYDATTSTKTTTELSPSYVPSSNVLTANETKTYGTTTSTKTTPEPPTSYVPSTSALKANETQTHGPTTSTKTTAKPLLSSAPSTSVLPSSETETHGTSTSTKTTNQPPTSYVPSTSALKANETQTHGPTTSTKTTTESLLSSAPSTSVLPSNETKTYATTTSTKTTTEPPTSYVPSTSALKANETQTHGPTTSTKTTAKPLPSSAPSTSVLPSSETQTHGPTTSTKTTTEPPTSYVPSTSALKANETQTHGTTTSTKTTTEPPTSYVPSTSALKANETQTHGPTTSTKTTAKPLLSSAPSTSVLPSSETQTHGPTTSTKTTTGPPLSSVPSTSVLPSNETKTYGATTSTRPTTDPLLSSAPSTSVLPSNETKTYGATTSTKTTNQPPTSYVPSTSALKPNETQTHGSTTSTKTTTDPPLSSAPSTSVLPSNETKTYATTTSTKTTTEPPTSYVPSTSALKANETQTHGPTTSTKTTAKPLLSSAPSTSVLPSNETKTYGATTSTRPTTDPLLSSAPSTSVLPSNETKTYATTTSTKTTTEPPTSYVPSTSALKANETQTHGPTTSTKTTAKPLLSSAPSTTVLPSSETEMHGTSTSTRPTTGPLLSSAPSTSVLPSSETKTYATTTSTKTTTEPLLSSAPSTSVLPSSETKTYGATTSTKTTTEPPTSYVPSTSALKANETQTRGPTTSTKTTAKPLLSSAPSTSVLPSSETETHGTTTFTRPTTDPLLSSAPSTSVLPSSESKTYATTTSTKTTTQPLLSSAPSTSVLPSSETKTYGTTTFTKTTTEPLLSSAPSTNVLPSSETKTYDTSSVTPSTGHLAVSNITTPDVFTNGGAKNDNETTANNKSTKSNIVANTTSNTSPPSFTNIQNVTSPTHTPIKLENGTTETNNLLTAAVSNYTKPYLTLSTYEQTTAYNATTPGRTEHHVATPSNNSTLIHNDTTPSNIPKTPNSNTTFYNATTLTDNQTVYNATTPSINHTTPSNPTTTSSHNTMFYNATTLTDNQTTVGNSTLSSNIHTTYRSTTPNNSNTTFYNATTPSNNHTTTSNPTTSNNNTTTSNPTTTSNNNTTTSNPTTKRNDYTTPSNPTTTSNNNTTTSNPSTTSYLMEHKTTTINIHTTDQTSSRSYLPESNAPTPSSTYATEHQVTTRNNHATAYEATQPSINLTTLHKPNMSTNNYTTNPNIATISSNFTNMYNTTVRHDFTTAPPNNPTSKAVAVRNTTKHDDSTTLYTTTKSSINYTTATEPPHKATTFFSTTIAPVVEPQQNTTSAKSTTVVAATTKVTNTTRPHFTTESRTSVPDNTKPTEASFINRTENQTTVSVTRLTTVPKNYSSSTAVVSTVQENKPLSYNSATPVIAATASTTTTAHNPTNKSTTTTKESSSATQTTLPTTKTTTTTVARTGTTLTTTVNSSTSAKSKEEQANQLLNQTEDVSKLNSSQVSKLLDDLKEILVGPTVSQSVGQKVLDVISNLINGDPEVLSGSTNRLIHMVDNLALKLEVADIAVLSSASLVLAIKTVDWTNFPETSVEILDINDVQLRRVRSSRVKRSAPALGSVDLPSSITSGLSHEEKQQASRVQFTFYKTNSLFKDSSLDNRTAVSPVLGSSVANLSISNLKDNITFTITHSNLTQDNVTSCVFWNFTKKNGSGGWDDTGCFVVSATPEYTTCSCNHLTSFAILLDLSREGIPDPQQAMILTFITYIGCGISAVFLAVTLITYMLFEKLLRDIPAKILVQLCLSLLLLNLVFLLDGWLSNYENVNLCISTAFFLHYFLLSSFTWAGLEALHMYLSIVRVFTPYLSKYMLKFSLMGWGIPLIVVVIIVAVDKNNYGLVPNGKYEDGTSDKFCWLRNDVAFYVGVVAYFLLIFVLCLVVFIVVMVQLSRIKKQNPHNQSPNRSSMTDIRSIIGLVLLLGLTWGFALFAWGKARLAFLYLFTICNSLLGLFVFIFHCAVKENVRRMWRTFLCCGNLRLAENSEWSRTATQNKLSAATATTSANQHSNRSSSLGSNLTNSNSSVFSGISDFSNSNVVLIEFRWQSQSLQGEP